MSHGEEWKVSLHPLAGRDGNIPMSDWLALTEEQQRSLSRRVNQTYERIADQQMDLQRKAEELARRFKKLPLWRRLPCLIWLHDIDDSMRREHIHRPDTFLRIILCRRCGSQFYESPFGLRRSRG